MKHFFNWGGSIGPTLGSILSILLVVMIAWIVYYFIVAYTGKKMSLEIALRKLGYGKSIGLFALVMGFIGQILGLIMLMNNIDLKGGIVPGLLTRGIGLPLMCALYGVLIYMVSLLMWFIASNVLERKLK